MGSVRWRITIASTIVVAFVLATAAVLVLRAVEGDLERRSEAAFEEAELAFDGGSPTLDIDGDEYILGVFEGDDDDEGEIYGELIGPDGEVSFELVIEADIDELSDLLDEEDELALGPLVYDALEESISRAEAAEGDTLYEIADELEEARESLEVVRGALWVTVPLLTGLFSILIYLLVGRALRPVDAITEQVASISSSDLDRRVPVPKSNDEVSELATVMNSMLDRLEAGARRQREFSADASHELRSPLTSIRAAAEMIGRRPHDGRVEGLAEDVVAEADRMDLLIGDLLTLARAEEKAIADPRPVALGEVADAVVDGIDPAIIELDAADGVIVLGDAEQLRRVIQNLVDNAVRHADSRVLVQVAAPALLTVEDDGPGVPVTAREEVFGRFSRVDDSRARTAGGTGLGLALVKAIAERHGAAVSVDDSPTLGGARFSVEF